MRILPNYNYEDELWKQGIKVVGGCDEVGRGCFAGPVVASCVVFKPSFRGRSFKVVHIDDSKRLTLKQREVADKWIKENALAWGIGEASVSEINRLGIVRATNKAFRLAITNCNKCLLQKAYGLKLEKKPKSISRLAISFLLVDAFYIPQVKGLPKSKQTSIIKGDQKSISIASASIIAKVHRDQIMTKLGKKPKYKKYNWHKNKGYGTKEHREVILKLGITKYHRTQFVSTFLQKLTNCSNF